MFEPTSLEVLTSVKDGPAVQIANGSEATWARDAARGRTWVRKRETNTGVEPLLAEAICWHLGNYLGAPLPNAAVYHDGSEWSWMSEVVPSPGCHWDPSMRDSVANPEAVGAMFALDAITLNEDRHAQNIIAPFVSNSTHVRLWAIDSGNAIVGYPVDFANAGLRCPDPRNHARGLPIQVLVDGAMIAAERAMAAVRDEQLRWRIEDVCHLTRESPDTVRALVGAIFRRCEAAPDIVARYLELLGELE